MTDNQIDKLNNIITDTDELIEENNASISESSVNDNATNDESHDSDLSIKDSKNTSKGRVENLIPFTSDNVDSDTDNNTDTSEQSCNIPNYPGLKPIRFGIEKDTLSHKEAVECGRKGGIKSGETRRRRKTARELLEKILITNMSDDSIDEVLGQAAELLGGDKTAYNVLMVKLLQVALSGDTKAIALLRDTAGDKPIDANVTFTDTLTEDDKKEIEKLRKALIG